MYSSTRFLERRHTEHTTKLLKDNKLKSCCRSETGPDRHKSTPEGEWSFLSGNLDHTVNSVVVDSGIDGLVHESCTDHIERTDSAGHEETSSGSGSESGEQRASFPASSGDDNSLGLVVNSHFGTVENHRTSNVGVNTTVESSDTLVRVELLCCAHKSWSGSSLGSHHFCLEDIEWVSSQGTDTTGGGTGSELLEEGGVLFRGAAESDLDRLVETKTEGCV